MDKLVMNCLIFYYVIFIVSVRFSLEIACKNGKNNDVDWFVNYKLPKIDEAPSGTPLAEGEAYAFVSSSKKGRWVLSPNRISSNNSMLGDTLNNFIDKKNKLTYILYNDDPPAKYSGTAVGHLKGVVAFDANSGFWLIHSIPKFPDEFKYEYPSNALLNGQSILCVTFPITELNKICEQLLYDHPNIYSKNLTQEVKKKLNDKSVSIFTDKPAFIRKEPFTHHVILRSLHNKPFTSFAKDNQFDDDLYSALIAPVLHTSLKVESWRRGSGTISPPECRIDYDVLDVESITMTFLNKNGPNRAIFKSTSDHSKWSISYDSSGRWICIGDINRMESQKRRGGGALCFQSLSIWKAYSSIINQTSTCGSTTPKN